MNADELERAMRAAIHPANLEWQLKMWRASTGAAVKDRHMQPTEELLQRLLRENAMLKATAESEQRHAAAGSPTTWAFNWRADSWGPGMFYSERHDFREGVGFCLLTNESKSCCIAFKLTVKQHKNIWVRAAFSFLDKHDNNLWLSSGGTEVFEEETIWEPGKMRDSTISSCALYPSEEEKARAVRADGSIRLRVVVSLE